MICRGMMSSSSSSNGNARSNSAGEAPNAIIERIHQLFQHARRVVIVSHIRPDGDAIGSTLGLGLALIQAGKEVRMVLADGIPGNFRHLSGSQLIHRSIPAEILNTYDLVIVVDASDLQRTGGILGNRKPDLNIDHHITNLNFGEINLVEPDQVATSAIIAEYLPAWGLSFNLPIAAALLTGIVTDTIGFRTSNMNAKALRLAAMLMEYGPDLPDLYNRALVSKSYEAACYWGAGLRKLQREEVAKGAGVIVWTQLTQADRQAAGYNGNDDADLVTVLASVDADMAVIFVEQKNGHTKVSWRARPGYDVSQIALKFGGGGHPAASGADINETLEAAQERVLAATRETLARLVAQNKDGKEPVQS